MGDKPARPLQYGYWENRATDNKVSRYFPQFPGPITAGQDHSERFTAKGLPEGLKFSQSIHQITVRGFSTIPSSQPRHLRLMQGPRTAPMVRRRPISGNRKISLPTYKLPQIKQPVSPRDAGCSYSSVRIAFRLSSTNRWASAL